MIFQQNSEIQYLHVKQQVVFCAEGHPCLQIMNLKEAMLFHWKKYYLKAAMFYLIGCLDPEINRQYIFYQIWHSPYGEFDLSKFLISKHIIYSWTMGWNIHGNVTTQKAWNSTNWIWCCHIWFFLAAQPALPCQTNRAISWGWQLLDPRLEFASGWCWTAASIIFPVIAM